MFSIKSKVAAAILLAITLVLPVFSQQAQQPTPAPSARGTDYVESTGFKGKVFDVKYRDPRSLIDALRPLGSGFKGATISFSDEFRTLTVRDFPENIAAIEEAVKRLDTPQAAQPDIELVLQVLIASNVDGATNEVPPQLKDVVKQLQSTLSYKSYYTLTTIIQRAKIGGRNVQGQGVVEVRPPLTDAPTRADYEYSFFSPTGTISVTSNPNGGYTVQIPGLTFTMTVGNLGRARIDTSLSVRDGERVVVGTSSLREKALILVLSARVFK